MSATDDLHPRLADVIESWSEDSGVPETVVLNQLEEVYNFDLTEVSDENAEAFAEAWEQDDVDAMAKVMNDEGIDSVQIQQFRNMVEPEEAAGESGNGNGTATDTAQPQTSTDTSTGSDDGLTDRQRQEIQGMIPSAGDIASEIQAQAGGGGGGSGGGQDQQGQAAMQLAQMFLQQQSSGASEIGEMFQKAAMKNYLKRLSRPSLGEIMEMKMYDKMSDQYAEEWSQEFMEGDPLDELSEIDEDEDDEGGFWSNL